MTAETKTEKYLAYLNGDTTIVLPEPETKVERYLYNLCLNGTGGSGGGASSWADLTGKPFESVGDGLTVSDGVLSAGGTAIFGASYEVDTDNATDNYIPLTLTLDEGTTADKIMEAYNSGKTCLLKLYNYSGTGLNYVQKEAEILPLAYVCDETDSGIKTRASQTPQYTLYFQSTISVKDGAEIFIVYFSIEITGSVLTDSVSTSAYVYVVNGEIIDTSSGGSSGETAQ